MTVLDRREFLTLAGTLSAFAAPLPPREPVPEPHFPNRIYLFIWRNWELANTERIAAVLKTTPAKVLEAGAQLGLPPKRRLTEDQLRRIYVTVIRQNWHVLPLHQLKELLGWPEKRLEFTLKEDDFLDVKLGREKPQCVELTYRPPTHAEVAQAAKIRSIVREVFGPQIARLGQEPFRFVSELTETRHPYLRDASLTPAVNEIDLSTGWAFAPSADAAVQRAAAGLSSYLKGTFGASVPVSLAGAKKIALRLTPESGLGAEGSRTIITDQELRIEADDPAGLMQAIYDLQDRMERREAPFLPRGAFEQSAAWTPRYLYSYFALYGDPLMEKEADPFPNSYLEQLGRNGINGVWLQGVLNTLAPSRIFPEFGEDWQTRLETLKELVRRAANYGVKVYLYLNEPRAMPDQFFAKYPEYRGAEHQGLYSLCTSVPAVREWIKESLAHVFHHVPSLGGIFMISMSENHTNCFSHGGGWGVKAPNAGNCPRCSKRASWDTLAELFSAMRDGVRTVSATADIIHYDWGWPDDMSEKLIPKLPRDMRILSISEWYKPVERGGVKTSVGEYSISVVGPGPRATKNWELAKKAGLTTLAKVQLNNTWEISAVPYIPTPQLILKHCDNLRKAGVSGLMASWTCGGYPSPNLAIAKAYYSNPLRSQDDILASVAAQRYGTAAIGPAIRAWAQFSRAFEEFPYGVAIYVIPVQHGPANLLRLKPTGYSPGMILFPHDAYKTWSGKYPPDVVQSQFAKMAAQWRDGLKLFEEAAAKTSIRKKHNAAFDLAIAKTCGIHFQSVANQVEFYLLRDQPSRNQSRMRAIANDEIALARQQYDLARDWSVIGYEASNHYYYRPLDLVEKVLNCRQILEDLKA